MAANFATPKKIPSSGVSEMFFMSSLEFNLIQKLKQKNLTIAFAESCTGGLASHRLTNIPGASEVFLGSFVTYSNRLKKEILGVSEGILKKYGAVSKECAKAMVQGLFQKTKASVCVSITGIAGPDGGTKEKPAGTIFVGYLFSEKDLKVEKYFFPLPRLEFKEKIVSEVFRKIFSMIA